jgi:hypothetical protein
MGEKQHAACAADRHDGVVMGRHDGVVKKCWAEVFQADL